LNLPILSKVTCCVQKFVHILIYAIVIITSSQVNPP